MSKTKGKIERVVKYGASCNICAWKSLYYNTPDAAQQALDEHCDNRHPYKD